jgi:alpha-methylacyl-CoA racemase
VVDAAMTDGSALLMSLFYAVQKQSAWSNPRGENLLDGGAPFYRCYRCADGEYMAVGALEPPFFAELLSGLGIPPGAAVQLDQKGWPAMERRFAETFVSKTRAEWTAIFEGRDACVTPVLTMAEAPRHPHNAARQTFVETDGIVRPAAGPRFSRTPSSYPESNRGEFDELLRRWQAPA